MITTAQSLIDVIRDAQSARTAVGHFNIADLALLKGVFEAARALNVPVIGQPDTAAHHAGRYSSLC